MPIPKLLLILCLTGGFSTSAAGQWLTFSTGTTTGFIMDLIKHNGDIYACGSITKIGGTNVNSVAKWTGTAWQPVGSSFTEWVHKLESISGNLYATPYNTTTDSSHLYKWDGSQWQKYGKGFYLTSANPGIYHASSLYDVAEYKGQLIVCGEFDVAGNKQILGIAAWDGSDWNALGTGLADPMNGSNIYPHKLYVKGNDLFAIGSFKKANGLTVNGIARWDGSQWHAMGDGFNGAVYGIEEYKGALYVCGEFTKSGTDDLYSIAKWNGTKWTHAGISLTTDRVGIKAFAHTLKSVGDILYVAGGFDKCIDVNGQQVMGNNVLEYDGTVWHDMDGGTNNDVEGILDYGNGQVLLAGGFSKAGSLMVNGMALWRSTLSVTDVVASGNIHLYPNPAAGQLHIDVEKPELISSMTIINIAGQEVARVKDIEKTTTINTSQLATGNYFIKLADKENKVKSYSFTKQ